jgi:ribosomal protein S18 acetylase RimI-like enzyme
MRKVFLLNEEQMDIIIRRAEKEDIPLILLIYSEIEFKNDETISAQNAEEIFSLIESYPDYHIYVAVCEKNIIGTFALLIMDNLGHGGKKSGVLEDVAVAKKWQGKGIGKKMMDYAFNVCRNAGCYKLTLSSNLVRESAHKFYESLNFKKHGYSYSIDIN